MYAIRSYYVFMPSFGVLGIGGIISFMLGGLFLMDRDVPVPRPVAGEVLIEVSACGMNT